jgi:hypothetical protein
MTAKLTLGLYLLPLCFLLAACKPDRPAATLLRTCDNGWSEVVSYDGKLWLRHISVVGPPDPDELIDSKANLDGVCLKK